MTSITTNVRENVMLFDFYLTQGSESFILYRLRRLALLNRVKMKNTLTGVQERIIFPVSKFEISRD